MSRLTLFLLGPPRIERNNEAIEIGRRKSVALIAYLAVTGQSHSRDALATLFWPEHDQSRARAGLRRGLASFKKAVGEGWLDVDRESVGLKRDAEIWLDVAEFQDRLAERRTHGHPAEEVCPNCLSLLAEAAELYRDDFLAGFTLRDSPAFDEWQFFQSQGLRADLASALERLADAHSEQGEYQPAIAYARRWLALDPLHEPAHRCLMGLYARSDQRAAALRQYQECERILREELDVSPQEETTRLYQAIKEHREGTPVESQPERYRLERRISSKGSFGDLWLATDTLLERPVAVKCPKVADDPIRRERFLTEARMLARLNHPNVTQIYDAFFDEGQDRFYLVMEYVDGKDVAEFIRGGTPLPLDWVLDVAGGILQALRYAHRQGVVHRDVKPDNIMIADDVKLTDFGLADLRSILEQGTRFLAGTPAYMAPEQIQGRATDGRADLYALGVILFEMLSGGRLPFDCADEVEMLGAHLHTDPPPVSQFAPAVPPMLEQVILRLLAKNPEERYPSAEAVMEALESIHAEPPPPFLEEVEGRAVAEGPVFVARQRELAQLDEQLAAALEGQPAPGQPVGPGGRVAFVTGEAGRGKTALLAEFARRAQAAHPELMVASGNCSAYSGIGDPYLPFRDVMGMLTGDVERAWAAGAITREHACRLWSLTPHTAQALADEGPDLIGVFVSGSGLVRRASAGAPGGADWLRRLQELAERERPRPGDLEQPQLFEQYTQVLRALAAGNPVLLTLDDLQWADTASINLLFHLGRRLEGGRILILGAYRPSEVALGRPSVDRGEERQHPLEPVINEFKRLFGDIQVDLGRPAPAEGREFVDAFLDTEPHRLGTEFRQALFRHTEGHPLFTVELLRDMQERGALVQDKAERWIEGPSLAWDALPARVEAVIEGRIGRLQGELREILTVASVEGEDFTAQVVARVQEADERGLVRQLSRELVKRHRLVGELGSRQVGAGRLHLYRFRHRLFQQHLYNGLGDVERELLHREIGAALEALYGEGCPEMAAQLAWHFAQAGESEKAIDYALQAGDQARGLYAHQEAIDHYQQALTFLKELGEHERAARTLMKLGLTYHTAFQFRQARQAYQEGFVLWQRAGEIKMVVPPPAPHALRLNAHEPTNLDPRMADSQNSVRVIEQLFSGLVELTPEMSVVPDVARSWEVSEGGRGYLFHLRHDVRWSDGTPVTAGDFEYAWKRVLDPATGSPNASLLYDVKGARAFHWGQARKEDVGVWALDEHTLKVELEGPTGYFLHLLAYTPTYPMPRHVVQTQGEAWTEVGKIVTNGPFRLEAWQPGESLVLARNPGYYRRFRGNIHRLELAFFEDPSAIEMYDADGLDILWLWALPVADLDLARQWHAGDYVMAPVLTTNYIGFSVGRPPFDDRRVRRAFALTIDQATVADVFLRGYASPATGGFIPPGMPGHSPEIGLPYDPEAARQLLAKAGYPEGHGFPIVDFIANWPAPSLEYLAAQWRENLGVEIRWETMGWATLSDKLHRDPPPLFGGGWTADYPDPDSFLRAGPIQGNTRWRNETYHRLVEEARRMMDQGERMKLYQEADRVLVQEAAIIPVTYSREHILVKPWIKNLPIGALGDWFWKDVIIEPH